jgi:hypothetical protein
MSLTKDKSCQGVRVEVFHYDRPSKEQDFLIEPSRRFFAEILWDGFYTLLKNANCYPFEFQTSSIFCVDGSNR